MAYYVTTEQKENTLFRNMVQENYYSENNFQWKNAYFI